MSSFDLNNTFGALLLGTIISSMLYGAMCLQSWHYYQNYSDAPLVKLAVFAIVILETLHSGFSIYAIYYYLILNYANPVALLKAHWSAVAVLFVTVIIICIVNSFYIWRVYLVSHRNAPLAIFIAILELGAVGTGLAVPILALRLQFFSDFSTLPEILVPADMSLALSAAIDILIAGSLTVYLRLGKRGMSNTNRIIDRLVVHAVNNGIILSIASVLCLIFATADKTNLIYLMIYQCIGNLNSNTMLSTLNTRKSTSRVLPGANGFSGLHALEFSDTALSSIAERGTMTKTARGAKTDNMNMDIEVNVQKTGH